jgi:hypothetical protein
MGYRGRSLRATATLLAAAAFGSCDAYQPTTPAPSPTPVVQATATPLPTPTPEPTPDPKATPESCPPLTRWSSGIHNMTDTGNSVVAWPLVGGHVVIDSTPLFNGRACNAEHDNCGGRLCEDPRGGEWTLLIGQSESEVRGDGYQFRIGPLTAGLHRWRVCPLRDAMDPQGVPLLTGQSACTEGIFTVLTEAPPQ